MYFIVYFAGISRLGRAGRGIEFIDGLLRWTWRAISARYPTFAQFNVYGLNLVVMWLCCASFDSCTRTSTMRDVYVDHISARCHDM